MTLLVFSAAVYLYDTVFSLKKLMSKIIDKVKYMTETYLMLNMLRLLGSTWNWRSNKLNERLYALLKVSWDI